MNVYRVKLGDEDGWRETIFVRANSFEIAETKSLVSNGANVHHWWGHRAFVVEMECLGPLVE